MDAFLCCHSSSSSLIGEGLIPLIGEALIPLIGIGLPPEATLEEPSSIFHFTVHQLTSHTPERALHASLPNYCDFPKFGGFNRPKRTNSTNPQLPSPGAPYPTQPSKSHSKQSTSVFSFQLLRVTDCRTLLVYRY